MNLEDILTNDNANMICEEIIIAFENEANEKSLEIDFKLNAGKMEVHYPTADYQEALTRLHGQKVPLPNTSLSFNPTKETKLSLIKTTVCNLIAKDLMTEDHHEQLSIFLSSVINKINSDEQLIRRVKTAIRKVNHAVEDIFPFSQTRVILFEFGAKEDYGDMIKVANYSRYSKQMQAFVGEKRAVAQDLLLRRRAFGYDSDLPTIDIYAKIIAEQKEAQNPTYADVQIEDVKIVKEAKECHLDIFVDYSPISKEEYEAKLTEIEAAHGSD